MTPIVHAVALSRGRVMTSWSLQSILSGIEAGVGPAVVQDALARAFADPELRLLVRQRRRDVDVDGAPADAAVLGRGRRRSRRGCGCSATATASASRSPTTAPVSTSPTASRATGWRACATASNAVGGELYIHSACGSGTSVTGGIPAREL